ncbi:carnitine/acylcarnitine translocase, putative [Acanthamoeba castellanii str. Neff]|uniref:Carnitine/acylcarnitine translocase, putative n=1 Tax=Acanthamoeba castellanii (strain ATCC 30010 / Neff) TaxID=1257118 RepID=L8GYX3_ACACF|nr:carnitine/acylcarnitine translocase, putative [Acanthamoeba castellanii str. Neff]ELR18132.1 carnitine/acylcarnitine translocase, putative [Acanthamoeba castellanii str. Neff]
MSQSQGVLKDTIAGGFGGACLVLVGHPLDTIKVRMQTMVVQPGVPPPYTSTWDCAMKTMKAEGPLALYKGMVAPLTGVTPMYSLCFLGYSFGQKIFCKEDTYKNLDLVRIGLAGATSGIFTTPILAPLERVKCLLQIQGKTGQYKGPWDCAVKLYKEGGIANVNKGYMATMLRDSVASFFYFSTYAILKHAMTPEGQAQPSAWGTLFAGGMAGIFNWLGCIPIDTLKTKLQTAPEGKYPNGIRSVFKDVIKNDGWRALHQMFQW